jgi:predicted nucleotidyltransferase
MQQGHDIEEVDVSKVVKRITTEEESKSYDHELTERVNTRIALNYSPEQEKLKTEKKEKTDKASERRNAQRREKAKES